MLKLRPHQQEVVDKIRAGFEEGHRAQLLYAPTGFGKTEVAMSIMQELAREYKRTAMVLDRIVLVNQTSARLSSYGINHGVLQADHWRYRPYEEIQVVSAQTLEKRGNNLKINVLIIDECHVQRQSVTDYIRSNPDIKVIGLTATPFSKGLGDIYTNIVGSMSTGQLIDKGWLTPLKVFIAKEIDMAGVSKVAGEWKSNEVEERGMKITGDIVDEWVKQTHRIFGGPRKSVIFCAGVAHGKDLERQFKERGYNFVSISYLEDDDFKRDTIEEFSKANTSIHGLIATDILTRGFDVPDVMIGVSARPFSKSFSSHVQQMGRIMRPYPGKEYAVWLDHGGNYLRFRDDWGKLFDKGVTELQPGGEKAKKEPTEKEKKESKCPACGSLWTWPSNTCGSCGHQRPVRGVATVAGELRELEILGLKHIAEQQNFYSEALHYAKIRGYKEGWAAHLFKEKFGSFPRGMSTVTSPPTTKTLNWIRSRQIAYAKRRTA